MSNVVMIGLPQTGKSAYLGTFWHIVEVPQMPEINEASSTPGDLRHVQMLADRLRGLEGLPRTHQEDDEEFNAPVRFQDGREATVRLPDVSGEHLQEIVERRLLPSTLVDELRGAEGLLLFVHPRQLKVPTGLGIVAPPDDVDHSDDGEAEAQPEVDQEPEGTGPKDFENVDACTAAQLVDCLENILEALSESWPIRIGVVISAFDLVSQRTPDKWLQERMPALRSFLATNDDRLSWTVYGVSAQGGKRSNREQLLERTLHERASAAGADGETVPFSAPVRWALGWD